MKIFNLLILIIICGCSAQESPIESYTVIENVNIIDVENGSLIPDRTIIIKDSIIYKIGERHNDTKYKNANLIDGKGLYIIPGLWDMHFHLCWEKTNDSLLFKPLLSYGITGIRDMGGDLSLQNHFKAIIKKNPVAGPNIYGSGPIFDGNPPTFYDFTIPVDEHVDVEKILDSIQTIGTDFIKTYSLIREPELIAISNYSTANNISFAGHLSEYITPEKSIKLGQKSVEHLNLLDDIWINEPQRIDSIIMLMQHYKSWICPTLVIYHMKAHISDPYIEIEEYNGFIHSMLMQEWVSSRERRISGNSKRNPDDIKNKFSSQKELLSYMHQNGVDILAGSDFGGMPYVYPGMGLHQELALLCEAGLSNAEALASATINPAIFLSIENKYGSISEGKIADLVLLKMNPLENIENTQAIVSVYRKGVKVKKLLPTMYMR